MLILTKTCTTCKKLLSLENFYKNRSENGGYAHTCKTCNRAYLKMNKDRYNLKRKERRHKKGISKTYREEQRKSKYLKVSHGGRYYKPAIQKYLREGYCPDWFEIRDKIYKRDNWICQECYKKCHNSRIKQIQCHHLDCNKSNNNENNLITLCASCHSRIHKTKSINLIEKLKTNIIGRIN